MKNINYLLFQLTATLTCAALLTGCGNSPEKARAKLAQLGKDYSSVEFVSTASKGDITAVRLFLDAGMNIDTILNYEGGKSVNALSFACIEHQEAIVKLLLERGADVNAIKDGSLTPLMCAVVSKKPEIVKLVLAKKPDLEVKSKDGATAMDYAGESETNEVKHLLIKAGAVVMTDLRFRDFMDWTEEHALTKTREVGERFYDNGKVDADGLKELVELFDGARLERWKNDWHLSDAQTCAMFMQTINGINTGVIRFIVVHSGTGSTAEKAVEPDLVKISHDCWDAFEIHFRSVASSNPKALNICDSDGLTPLMLAARDGRVELAKWLLSKGADLNRVSDKHNNALGLAEQSANTEIVKMLKEAGAR